MPSTYSPDAREREDASPAWRPRWTALLLLAILAASTALRFWALDFGRGAPMARPDELAATAFATSYGDAPSSSPSSSFLSVLGGLLLQWGGGYLFPLLAFVRGGAWLLWGRSAAEQAALDPVSVTVLARAWSALLAVATVAVVFAAARRISGIRAGLIAAGILACAPLAVREAHFAKADSAASFVASLVALAVVRPWRSSARRAVAIGAVAGLALSTKLLVSLLPGELLGLWESPQRAGRLRSAALALLTTALVTAALNPFALGSPATMIGTLLSLVRMLKAEQWVGHDTVAPAWLYYPDVALRHGVGLGPALLSLPALVLGVAKRGPTRWIALMALTHLAVIATQGLLCARFFLPALPGLVVLVGALSVEAIDRVARTPRVRALATAAVALALVAGPMSTSITLVRLLSRADTRALASEWIEKNLSRDARVAVFGAPSLWTPFVYPDLRGRAKLREIDRARWEQERVDYVLLASYPMPYGSGRLPQRDGLELLVVFDPFTGPTAEPVLEPMDAFFLPLARFAGVARPGPRIELYRRTRDH